MTIVKATVYKPSKRSKLGLRLRRNDANSPLTISSIPNDGLFQETPLIAGLVVLKINDQDVTWMSPQKACDVLRSIKKGKVSVTAEGFVARIARSRADESLGIVLEKRKKSNDDIFISRIREDSKFFDTDIKPGMKLVSINGSPCPVSAIEAIRILRNTIGAVKVVAVNFDREQPTDVKVPECERSERIQYNDTAKLLLENDAMRWRIEELETQVEREKLSRCSGQEVSLRKVALRETRHICHPAKQNERIKQQVYFDSSLNKGQIHEDFEISLDAIEVQQTPSSDDQERRRSGNRFSFLKRLRRRKSASPRVDITIDTNSRNQRKVVGSYVSVHSMDHDDPLQNSDRGSDTDTPETIVHRNPVYDSPTHVNSLSDNITLGNESDDNSTKPLHSLHCLAEWPVHRENSWLHGEDIPIPEPMQEIETQLSSTFPNLIILNTESKTIDVDNEGFSVGDQIIWDVLANTADEDEEDCTSRTKTESTDEWSTDDRYLKSIGLAGPSPWDVYTPERDDTANVNPKATDALAGSPIRETEFNDVSFSQEEHTTAAVQRYLERIGLADPKESYFDKGDGNNDIFDVGVHENGTNAPTERLDWEAWSNFDVEEPEKEINCAGVYSPSLWDDLSLEEEALTLAHSDSREIRGGQGPPTGVDLSQMGKDTTSEVGLREKMERNLHRQRNESKESPPPPPPQEAPQESCYNEYMDQIQINMQEAHERLRKEWTGTAESAATAWESFVRMF